MCILASQLNQDAADSSLRYSPSVLTFRGSRSGCPCSTTPAPSSRSRKPAPPPCFFPSLCVILRWPGWVPPRRQLPRQALHRLKIRGPLLLDAPHRALNPAKQPRRVAAPISLHLPEMVRLGAAPTTKRVLSTEAGSSTQAFLCKAGEDTLRLNRS